MALLTLLRGRTGDKGDWRSIRGVGWGQGLGVQANCFEEASFYADWWQANYSRIYGQRQLILRTVSEVFVTIAAYSNQLSLQLDCVIVSFLAHEKTTWRQPSHWVGWRGPFAYKPGFLLLIHLCVPKDEDKVMCCTLFYENTERTCDAKLRVYCCNSCIEETSNKIKQLCTQKKK